jgi:hypothetical protein
MVFALDYDNMILALQFFLIFGLVVGAFAGLVVRFFGFLIEIISVLLLLDFNSSIGFQFGKID